MTRSSRYLKEFPDLLALYNIRMTSAVSML